MPRATLPKAPFRSARGLTPARNTTPEYVRVLQVPMSCATCSLCCSRAHIAASPDLAIRREDAGWLTGRLASHEPPRRAAQRRGSTLRSPLRLRSAPHRVLDPPRVDSDVP